MLETLYEIKLGLEAYTFQFEVQTGRVKSGKLKEKIVKEEVR